MAEKIECDGQKRDQVVQRKEKLENLRKQGFNYPNDKQPTHKTSDISENKSYQLEDKEKLGEKNIQVSVAGRMMTRRLMGKASFFNIQDRSGQIQVYARANDLPEELGLTKTVIPKFNKKLSMTVIVIFKNYGLSFFSVVVFISHTIL